jgi:hypothetical protein
MDAGQFEAWFGAIQAELDALRAQLATLTDNRDAWVLLATNAQNRIDRLLAAAASQGGE